MFRRKPKKLPVTDIIVAMRLERRSITLTEQHRMKLMLRRLADECGLECAIFFDYDANKMQNRIVLQTNPPKKPKHARHWLADWKGARR